MLTFCVGLSVDGFFKSILADDAPASQAKLMEREGEQKIEVTPWADPTGEEKVYNGEPVIKTRVFKMEKQIIGNPFCKVAPTTRQFKILEHTSELLHMKILTTTNDIPYCDNFAVEEEWWIASPAGPQVECCVYQASYTIIWYKSSMMKRVIKSSTESNSQEGFELFKKWILTDNGYTFVEKEKPDRVLKKKIKA
jgi:hypothetical protein